jgi:hypothetical protein
MSVSLGIAKAYQVVSKKESFLTQMLLFILSLPSSSCLESSVKCEGLILTGTMRMKVKD